MNKSDIATSIQTYNDLRWDSQAMIDYFGQGNCFAFDLKSYPESSPYIHAYPGIFNGNLLFFMIPSYYDNEAFADDIEMFVEVCPVLWQLEGTNHISSLVAAERIILWEAAYPEWIAKQVETHFGMFQAFQISIEDFEVPDTQLTLGLKMNGETTDFTADLIVANKEGKKMSFDDFTEPVPPYGASADINNFYLLQMSL